MNQYKMSKQKQQGKMSLMKGWKYLIKYISIEQSQLLCTSSVCLSV